MTSMDEAVSPLSEGSVELLGIEAIRRRAKQLSEMQRNRLDSVEISSDSNKVLEDILIEFQNRSMQFEWEDPNVGFSGLEELESYLGHLEKEFQFVEDENSRISDEIGALTRTMAEDSVQLDSDLEGLNCSLNLIVSEGVDKYQTGALDGVSISRSSQGSMTSAWEDHKLEILELDQQIEMSNLCLNLLKDLDFVYKRVEAVGEIEDMLSEVKAIKFDKNCITLTIRMPIPTSDWLLLPKKLDCAMEPSVLDYELSIEIVDGTIEVKNVEISPGDVSLDGVIDATKSLRQFFSSTSVPIVRSSLESLVTQVHQHILFAFLRHSMVRDANKSRHSFEYSDRDGTVIAHLVGGIDAFIKISEGWPVSRSSLKLISIKNLAIHSTSISLGFLCKVKCQCCLFSYKVAAISNCNPTFNAKIIWPMNSNGEMPSHGNNSCLLS